MSGKWSWISNKHHSLCLKVKGYEENSIYHCSASFLDILLPCLLVNFIKLFIANTYVVIILLAIFPA